MLENGDDFGSGIDDDLESRPTRRFGRLAGHPAVRRLSARRLAWASLAAIAALGLVGVGGYQSSRRLARWVATLPENSIGFGEIRLDPPAPPWVFSKSSGTLERIAAESRRAGPLAILNVDLGELRADFSRDPWVAKVDRIQVARRGLVVRLAFRKPVAVVENPGRPDLVIDADGVILPSDDIDWIDRRPRYRARGVVAPLLAISQVQPPLADTPGLVYRTATRPAASNGGDLKVLRCARLAGFLLGQIGDPPQGRGRLDPVRIIPAAPSPKGEADGVFVVDRAGNHIYWGSAPGAESTQVGIPAEAKWRFLLDWLAGHGDPPWKEDEFLYFDRKGASIKRFLISPPQSARSEGRSGPTLSR